MLESNSPQNFANDVQAWRNHIIIVGVNNLSLRILEQLETTGLPIVFIDDEPEEKQARALKALGYDVINDDSRVPQVLLKAGLATAFALIVVEYNDLHNLETVLEANELRPGLRMVANFFNEELGRQLATNLPNARVVSLSEKASPSFVNAALSNRIIDVFRFEAAGQAENIFIVQVTVASAGSVDELFGTLTVPALNLAPTQEAAQQARKNLYEFMPSPVGTTPLKPGDLVMVAGRAEELKKHPYVQLQPEEILQAVQSLNMPLANRKIRPVVRVQNLTARLWQQIGNSIRFAGAGVFTVMLLGTLIFKNFYRNIDPLTGQITELDWLTSLYFTVTIMSTTGFGDFNLAQQDWGLKIFGIFMMITGAATVAVLYAFLTNFFISLRLDEELGRSTANQMENHVVMCGLGTVGYRTLKGLLKRGQSVVVVEPKEEARFNAEVRALGVPIIKGDARSRKVMQEANLEKARCLAIMTSDDLVNLEIALLARDMCPDRRVVLRLFDRKLAARIENSFNIHIARSASALAAPAFIAEVFNYEQLSTFYVEKVAFTTAREVISPAGGLVGLSLGELEQRTGVTVLVYSSDNTPNFHPTSDLILQAGDMVVQVGPYDTIIRAHLLNTAL